MNTGKTHDVDFRPYVVSDFEAVAALWARVNRELAPAGMETLFERYIATTIEGELSRLPDIFSQARRNAFWVVELRHDPENRAAVFRKRSCPIKEPKRDDSTRSDRALAGGSRRIVGTFGIERHASDTTELRRMYIDAGWRGCGLAERMLRTAEATARELGFSRMIVSTADIQRAAFRFYTKSGFRRVKSEIAETMTVRQAGGGLLRHYFEKEL